MTSFLPKLEDTLVDLLQYGDTGVLRVSLDPLRWSFYVQGGVLTGIERQPEVEDSSGDPTEDAARLLTEAMKAKGALWDFVEGTTPEGFGLFDARRALAEAVGRARDASDLIAALRPVLEGWPELTVDADTLTGDPEVQAWLATLDGLAPGNNRLLEAPPRPGPALGALWVAWKLGDLELNAGAIEDDDPSEVIAPTDVAAVLEEVDGAGSALLDEHHDEDTDEDGSETAQTLHTASSPADRRRLLEELAARNRVGREDPFIAGVTRARAGEAAAALPLLEEAWEIDPERPGLEEWLGYTRFAACRDSDPEKARQGLSMLRDVMYRTGPSGETPILPWILMARAQFERGDLVQARSQLNAVLEREPDDPEALHLGTELAKAEAEAARLRPQEKTVDLRRVWRLTGGFVVLSAVVVALQVRSTHVEPRDDHSSRVAHVVPLRELHQVARGWVGVTARGWQAPGGREAVHALCESAHAAVQADDQETLLLLTAEGIPLVECGPRIGHAAPVEAPEATPPEPEAGGSPDDEPTPEATEPEQR